MTKIEAIALLGGTMTAAAAKIGISIQAVSSWPEQLPSRISDRVEACLWREQQATLTARLRAVSGDDAAARDARERIAREIAEHKQRRRDEQREIRAQLKGLEVRSRIEQRDRETRAQLLDRERDLLLRRQAQLSEQDTRKRKATSMEVPPCDTTTTSSDTSEATTTT